MRRQSRTQKNQERSNKGARLVSSYQLAIVNLSTAITAEYHAKLSEQRAVNYISNAPVNENSIYVTPQDIPDHMQDTLANTSMDAHMKKVQAEQISRKTSNDTILLEQLAKRDYAHKKVQVTILEANQHPVESYWQHNKSGKVTTGQVKSKKIKGTIEDINLNKNLLILKPTRLSRTFNPERKLFAIYVINPDSLQPMISIDVIR